MLYFVAAMLVDSFNVLNVLTYHTVRAGGAAVTGFALCLLFGPALIRRLRALLGEGGGGHSGNCRWWYCNG